MRQVHTLFTCFALCAWVVAGCGPISQVSDTATETVNPRETQPGVTAIPTLTPKEQMVLITANAYLGDKLANLRFEYIKNIGMDSKLEYRVVYQQVFQEIPVWSNEVLVFVEANGEVWSYGVYDPDVDVANVVPNVTLDTAVQIAAQAIGIQGAYTLAPYYDPNTELVIYPIGHFGQEYNNYVLAWYIVLSTECPIGDWNVMVNATDKTVLSLFNRRESPKPLVSRCATPLPLPTLTAPPTRTSPPPTSTPVGYPVSTRVPSVSP